MRRPFASAVLGFVCSCGAIVSCDYDSGGPLPELGVFAAVGDSSFSPVLCVQLPLLQGSQVDARGTVDGSLEVTAEATRKGVDVHFRSAGQEAAPSVFVPRDGLLDTFLQTKDVTVGGETYRFRFTPNCDDSSGNLGTGGRGAGGFGNTGGRGNTGGLATGGAGGAGGTGSGGRQGPPPVVDSYSPSSGPYGTTITIKGSNFRTPETTDLSVSINDQDRINFEATSPFVVSWTTDTIRFRFPFPADGPMRLDQPTANRLEVGKFSPSFAPGPRHLLPGSTSAITAISDGPGRIIAVLDTSPPTLVSADGRRWTRQALTFESLRPDTIRLYRAGDGIRGFALSTADPPEILALERRIGDAGAPPVQLELGLDGGVPSEETDAGAGGTTGTGGAEGSGGAVADGGTPDGGAEPDVDIIPGEAFDAIRTGVTVSTQFTLAGGDAGAVVWFLGNDGWRRVRPGAGTWFVDKGPIADPNPSAPLHAVVATSDGALHVLWAEETGGPLDDTGTPFVQSLPSASSTFGTPRPAGGEVDDFLTTLVAESRGDGFVVRYCGSDVDDLGFSGSEYRCRLALHRADGESIQTDWKDDRLSSHAISGSSISAFHCDTAAGQSLVPDAFTATTKKLAIWPCSPVVAMAIDPEGVTRLIVRGGSGIYSPRER